MPDSDPVPVPLSTHPASQQLVDHDDQIYTTVREGRAYILVPPTARTSVDPKSKSKDGSGEGATSAQNVFYNPIQQFNRDLSVLAIKAYGEDACERKKINFEGRRGKREGKKERKAERTKRKRGSEEQGQVEEQRSEKVRKGVVADIEASGVIGTGAGVGRETEQDADEERHESAHAVSEQATTVNPEQTDTEIQENEVPGAVPQADGAETAATNETTTQDVSRQGPDLDQVAKPKNTQQPWRARFRILDALSATGLRALRYASEIPFVTSVVANDRDRNAVKSIGMNAEHNRLSSSITAAAGDAIGHMYRVAFPSPNSHGPHHISGKYDVIDLDPYGTAAPFIDSALQALEDGGMLCVTCTDSGVFASCGYSEKTFALYGGMPVKGIHCHEGGLRLILNSIATSASKYGLAIEPLLSLSIDFYARLFIRVRKSPNDVKFLAGKTMLAYECDHGCGAWTLQSLGRHQLHKDSNVNWKYTIGLAPTVDSQCDHCSSKMHLSGPMWGGPLHNAAFIEKVLEDLEDADAEVYSTKKRVEGMLTTALDELSVLPKDSHTPELTEGKNGKATELIPMIPPQTIDRHPFFFIPSALCKVIKAQAPAESLLRGAIRHAGYVATRSHCRAGSIKTNAPWAVLWEIMREWVRQRAPVKPGALKEGQAGFKILEATKRDTYVEAPSTGAADGTEMKPEGSQENGAQTDNGASTKVGADKRHDRLEVVFDERLGRDEPGRKKLVRYQMNPRENWGPMAKAKGSG